MSKWCRYVTTLQVYFVKMVQVQNNFSRLPVHHMYHTTNASLIIESSKCLSMQSNNWSMTTSNPKEYLRNVISLVTSLCLHVHQYSFVPLLPNALFSFRFKYNSSPNNEHSERLMEENVTMKLSSFVTYLLSKNWPLFCELASLA